MSDKWKDATREELAYYENEVKELVKERRAWLEDYQGEIDWQQVETLTGQIAACQDMIAILRRELDE